MTAERHDHKAKSIIRIHVAKRQLGMSDKEYREALEGQTGKTSCKGMTLRELFTVEEYFKKLGFKPTLKRHNGKRLSPKTRHKKHHEKTMVDKIRALWIDLHKKGAVRDGSENALEKWVERMSARHNHGKGIQKLEWLGQNEFVCWKVLEALKSWHKREI